MAQHRYYEKLHNNYQQPYAKTDYGFEISSTKNELSTLLIYNIDITQFDSDTRNIWVLTRLRLE